jgi:serine protease Do
MHRLIVIGHVLLLVLIASGALGGTRCPDMPHRFPVPASEMVQVVADWLVGQGLTLHKDYPRPGYVHLVARCHDEHWEITIRPQSALASVTGVVYEGSAVAEIRCRQLHQHIQRYLYNAATDTDIPAEYGAQSIPAAVLEHFEAVVCLRARSGARPIQLSGFVVDPEGLILCTAHDLGDRQRVTVTFYDGEQVPGTVSQLDSERDLALIDCPTRDRVFVPLVSGRNLLGMGERVFSIGCPNNLKGTLAPGFINGPPRLVSDQPLWQVDMDIFPGSSGSPVFDSRGRLVAMVKGRYRGTSTVGFLTPLETIIGFLTEDDQ